MKVCFLFCSLKIVLTAIARQGIQAHMSIRFLERFSNLKV